VSAGIRSVTSTTEPGPAERDGLTHTAAHTAAPQVTASGERPGSPTRARTAVFGRAMYSPNSSGSTSSCSDAGTTVGSAAGAEAAALAKGGLQ